MGFSRTKLTGVTTNLKFKASNGYTLISPLGSKEVWLIDMEGQLVFRQEFIC